MKGGVALMGAILTLVSACSASQSVSDASSDADAIDSSVTDGGTTDASPFVSGGKMKMFFNAEIKGPSPAETDINIRSASTTDGFNFTLDPEIWITSRAISDPVVYRAKSGKWLIAGFHEGEGIRVGVNDGSPDFTKATFTIAAPKGQVPSLLEFEDGFRLYYLGEAGIVSAFSKDGVSWSLEPGVRVSPPADFALAADPAPARRKDGTIVIYFKTAPKPSGQPTPYDDRIYRATSKDGLTFTTENKVLVEHAGVPQAFTAADGRVGIYYLDFTKFPKERENIAGIYENEDFSLTTPRAVTFDSLPQGSWANDPCPVLVPN